MKNRIGLILAIIVFIIQLLLLPQVGFTWDEPSIYFIGQRNLDFWTSRNWRVPPDYGVIVKPTDGPFRNVWGAKYYPPLVPTLASFTSTIFSRTLHTTDYVVGHHLALIILGSLGIFALYETARLLGFPTIVATGLTLLYAFYPTISGQMRNDAKDIPLASAILIFLYCFFHLLKHLPDGSKHVLVWTLGSGVALGCAILVKPTAVLIPTFGILISGFFFLFPSFRKKVLTNAKLLLVIVPCIALLSFLTVVACWPFLWPDVIGRGSQALAFFRSVGIHFSVLYFGNMYQSGVNLPWHYPWGILLVQTPPIVLLFAILGGVYALYLFVKKRKFSPMFFLLWFVLGMMRFAFPGFIIYAKVRHFIDVMPAFFFLVGWGIKMIGELGKFGKLGEKVVFVVMGIAILHEVVIFLQFVPYEPSYFNVFVGGTKTVAEKRLFDAEYWGSSVKEGMQWIGKTDSKRKLVIYACTMGHLAKHWVSDTMRISRVAQNADYLLVPNSGSWFGTIIDIATRDHLVVYKVRRADADLLYVFKRTEGKQFPQCGDEGEDDLGI